MVFPPREGLSVFFNVAQLLREATGAERTYEIDAEILVEEDAPPSQLHGSVRLVRTHRGLLGYFTLDGNLADTCSRCLGIADAPVTLRFEEEFLPSVDVHTGALLPREHADAEVLEIDGHHHLDVTEAARQALVLEQSMQPLCRADCAGLCVECGANLNERRCGCHTERADARWAALRSLISNENGAV